MTKKDLSQLLKDITKVRVAVIGDFCLDAYWFIDPSEEEISIETRLTTRPIHRQRYSLGGAGNVVMNLLAMGVKQVFAFGVVGDDPFTHSLIHLLRENRVEPGGLLTQDKDWSTHVFIKPHLNDAEQNRIDFGNFNRLADSMATELVKRLEAVISMVDVVIINEQVKSGIHFSAFLQKHLAGLVQRKPAKIFLLDSRHYSDKYAGTIRQINEHEAVRLCGIERDSNDPVLDAEAHQAAKALYKQWGKPVFVSRGAKGCMVCDEKGVQEVPGIPTPGRVDPVGAGDSLLAGIAAALGAKRDNLKAATLGNLVAGVTVQKLFQTGTATPDEIMAIANH